MTTLALITAGAMGSAIAARPTGRDPRVITGLEGRSPASWSRALVAGMEAADETAIGRADFVLSVVPRPRRSRRPGVWPRR